MTIFGSERVRDEAVLVARLLLAVLFFEFGWGKLTDYSGTAGSMARTGAPMPSAAALVAIAVEVLLALGWCLGLKCGERKCGGFGQPDSTWPNRPSS